jgi:hypothetical protein
MAKGQQKSNREAKKPKQVKAKPASDTTGLTNQLAAAKAKKK